MVSSAVPGSFGTVAGDLGSLLEYKRGHSCTWKCLVPGNWNTTRSDMLALSMLVCELWLLVAHLVD